MSVSTNPGSTFGKYHVVAELGRGGMAKVYLAVARGPAGFSKLLVLKQLRANLSIDGDFLAMFLDEARLAARLNHPNIVQTNEVGQIGETYFIAMEYLDGQPLVNIIRRAKGERTLPLSAILRIVADACAGLHYAHQLRNFDGTELHVVHRDVSPQNIFVTYGGQVKIVDFGIAKAASGTVETQTGVLKGKVAYMPPEQVQGEAVDHRADIFALGVVLFEAITRQRLWSVNDVDIIRELLKGKVPGSPKAVKPDVPDEIDRICQRALAPLPADRYATALEMQRDLEKALESLPARTTAHDIGELISQMFQKEREELDKIIDGQIRAMEAAPDGNMGVVSIPTLSIGGALAHTPSRSMVGSIAATGGITSTTAPGKAPNPWRAALLGLLAFSTVVGIVFLWLALSHPRSDTAALRAGDALPTNQPLDDRLGRSQPSSLSAAATPPATASASAQPIASAAPVAASADADIERKAPATPRAVQPSVVRAPPPVVATAVKTAASNPLGDRK